jgi:hypothetical protein
MSVFMLLARALSPSASVEVIVELDDVLALAIERLAADPDSVGETIFANGGMRPLFPEEMDSQSFDISHLISNAYGDCCKAKTQSISISISDVGIQQQGKISSSSMKAKGSVWYSTWPLFNLVRQAPQYPSRQWY